MQVILASLHDHANQIFELEKTLFSHNVFSLREIEDEIQNENRLYLVVVIDNVVVGYVGINLLPDIAEVLKIAVRTGYQNKGVATMLINEVIKVLKQKNYDRLLLEVASENEVAISFYNKTGFKKLTKRKNYYENGDDAIVMEFKI